VPARKVFSRRPLRPMVDRLIELIELYRPTVVVTYPSNGLSGHPDHIRTHTLVRTALRAVPQPPLLYYIALSRSRLLAAQNRVRAALAPTRGYRARKCPSTTARSPLSLTSQRIGRTSCARYRHMPAKNRLFALSVRMAPRLVPGKTLKEGCHDKRRYHHPSRSSIPVQPRARPGGGVSTLRANGTIQSSLVCVTQYADRDDVRGGAARTVLQQLRCSPAADLRCGITCAAGSLTRRNMSRWRNSLATSGVRERSLPYYPRSSFLDRTAK